jgi:hypothetical protein
MLKYHVLPFVHGCLFNIFAATLHSWRPFLHPQLRTGHAVVTGTHLTCDTLGWIKSIDDTLKVAAQVTMEISGVF